FVLSCTGPLLPTWYCVSNGGAMPYRFFALSIAGSMLGLLAYPVLVEPYLTSKQQAWMWSASYALFAVICAVLAFRSRAAQVQSKVSQADSGPPPTLSERLLWMGLAACASALLLALTNH